MKTGKPKLPKSVRVGAIDYAMSLVSEFKPLHGDRTDQEYSGQTHHHTAEVFINDETAYTVEREIVVHEILHCAIYQTNADLDSSAEEELVVVLAPILLDTLDRNPKLRRYLWGNDA